MTHRTDLKLAALETLTGLTGHVADLEMAWLESVTGTTGHRNDLWMLVFLANGATTPSWPEAAFEFLVAYGITPTEDISQMWDAYWAAGGGAGAAAEIIRAWEFEETSNNVDATDDINGSAGRLKYQSGTLNDWATGKIGRAVQVGNSGYYTCINPGDFNVSESFAISAWVTVNLISAGALISNSRENVGFIDRGFKIAMASPNYHNFYLTNTQGSWDHQLNLGTWGTPTNFHHILCGWSKEDEMAYGYVDNVLVASKAVTDVRETAYNEHVMTDPGAANGFYGGFTPNYVDQLMWIQGGFPSSDQRNAIWNSGSGDTVANILAAW